MIVQPTSAAAASTTGSSSARRWRSAAALTRAGAQRRAGRRELLAHARQRRPALADLRLQPRALRQQRAERRRVEPLGGRRELVVGELAERAAGVDRDAHEAGDDAVALAKRDAAA